MRAWWNALISATALLAVSTVTHAQTDAQLQEKAKAAFGTLPAVAESPDNPVTEEKIRLGRMLYYDPRLSINDKISCNTCHLLDQFGVDHEKTSEGHAGERGVRNSPTSYNAAFQFAQFWDGRAATVEEQAKGPILNPVEMGMKSEADVVAKLHGIKDYAPLFRDAFPGSADAITYDNLARAIGAFERKLVTPSRFDDFLDGKADALSEKEKKGLAKFMDTGCTACHSGRLVGGMMFQKLGLVKPFPATDIGRAEVTGNDADKYFFKVPSLRNVTKTGPYLHNGSVDSLQAMVKAMGEYQLGRTLNDEDTDLIIAFLDSLTGRVDDAFIKKPDLPK